MNLLTIDAVNALERKEFVTRFGGVFEHSPWVAEAAVEKRPFNDRCDLHAKMIEALRKAGRGSQVSLIGAHPDLGELVAKLTEASKREQASAGMNDIGPEQLALFHRKNAAYRERFGFPFVICARLNNPDTILNALDRRISNDRETEVDAALEEIAKIASLRLADLVEAP